VLIWVLGTWKGWWGETSGVSRTEPPRTCSKRRIWWSLPPLSVSFTPHANAPHHLARREGREEETGQGDGTGRRNREDGTERTEQRGRNREDGTERTEQRGRNREDGIERMEQRRREREDRIERTGQRTRQGGRNGKDGTRRTKKRE
jgi:hypothetical protein